MTMADSKDSEIQSVRRAAEKAWVRIERKQRKALAVALEAKRQLEELDVILGDREPPNKVA
jgi:hypothetical protein